ncbi:MAG: N-acetylmannosamine-6-phosphate 2-epimerase [Actinobacteria bacterium]|jgi:N-acylglucosamine-6-phosphate 2-epimerase|uniref:Putative N-acetylmannosamine-6-phosphate 2-epimerase n=1 Tax=Phycicoccus elongatus Lp2 TaxID=1193181 RepID=N0DXW0_9MICO|nr:N-acetylmannosamine-6-phosphate 2-epimerase [Phycicoccus elongatus]MCA0321668.1 N-acetylmannosamine-6-phosphate 2-epimerase [Actinomycetota bacterium]CCH68792.1 putative N-acetylmannosamine-6-phosphate 2-epimerase [Phycicoccus elongatus Lp2]
MSRNVIDAVRGGLIVSCQAYPGEPMRDPDTMTRIARSVVRGGAVAVRAQGLADLHSMRAALSVPLIGLWKDGHDGVFITPSVEHALAVARTGAQVVAIDGTRRPRPDGSTFADACAAVHDAGALVMADCATLADGHAAAAAGADLVGTTLAGYTPDSPKTPGPDLDLVAALAAELDVPVIAEGRIHTPADALAAMHAGAHAVVVGTAITHPSTITAWFAAAVSSKES